MGGLICSVEEKKTLTWDEWKNDEYWHELVYLEHTTREA
jgi:hypothetical protein